MDHTNPYNLLTHYFSQNRNLFGVQNIKVFYVFKTDTKLVLNSFSVMAISILTFLLITITQCFKYATV